jgi:hypothetical protein
VPRPSFQPKEEQRKLVKSLSAMGLCQDDICDMVGLRSPKTLRKHFRQELASGMAEANTAVARVAYEMAVSGRYPAMTFFWAKCQRKRVEQVEEEEPTKPYKVEIRFPGKEGVPAYGSEASHAAV